MFGNITSDHVEEAALHLTDSGIPPRQKSRVYSVIVNGKEYPPKYLITVAFKLANGGAEPTDFNTYQAQDKLTKLGFERKAKDEPPFFSKEDFELLDELVKQRKDSSNERHKEVYEQLKRTYVKIEFWARRIQEEIFPEGRIGVLKKPTNQANYFNEYQWAKIYPTQSSRPELAFTVSISDDHKFVIKIDTATLSDQDERRIKYFQYRGDWESSQIVKIHDENKILSFDWSGLIELSLHEIQDLIPHYEALLKILFPLTPTVNSTMQPLNLILYGPPGTGKTYNSINKAIEIANPNFPLSEKTRAEIKNEYNRLFKEGRITFLSFHQSLSYEDFIEGIKPKTLNEKVVYEIEDGIFKSFCNTARFINGNFEEIVEKFKADISESDGRKPITIRAQTTSFDIIYRGTNVFYVQPHNSTKENAWYPVNIDNLLKAFETDSYTKIYNPTYVREVINHLKKTYGLVKGNNLKDAIKQNYVLIIDEINRGNISQIFGELITLLEPDKREGRSEELQVQLPYSKQLFSVPDNMYIIGTMNTADRSVEALDTALRRRFNFEFMPPNIDVLVQSGVDIEVGGHKVSDILMTINERLSYLLDDDHQIGHSYFYQVQSPSELGLVFKNKVIPLLQEFFFNDQAKLRLVLGDRFVEKINTAPKFATRENEDFIIDKSRYKVRKIDGEFDLQDAIQRMMDV